ncbi:L-serine ammonia-lyase [Azospirillum rugosum]|uniref:L-serine dehydratase n=1 Tax=Azospirillum rugosum TaxID=416170 RepID=A0ABS4SL24_9PROT|nr:L-serine ammonia-lyase [Azospirillum rugosum]MBP2293264.1 L-serine dehydratase [Azospirillum rugosum]
MPESPVVPLFGPGTRLRPAVPIGVTDCFAIGIGPSSSHTVGPMRAAHRFARDVLEQGDADGVTAVTVELFGSLALTGHGHQTDVAVLLGLSGWLPETVDPDAVDGIVEAVRTTRSITLDHRRIIPFDPDRHLLFRKDRVLEGHPNGMRFTACERDRPVLAREFHSVGGGAIVCREDAGRPPSGHNANAPYPFTSAAELLAMARGAGLSIAGVILANERALRDDRDTFAFLDTVRSAMMDSIERGCRREGMLPGGLNLRRRAPALHRDLNAAPPDRAADPLHGLDWVSLYALAVNEENAAGGRIVTAPTNGAAGVIPAVLKYYETFCQGASPEKARDFLLTAAGIGALYKTRASISAAEMGCQGEVGVACSMAAGALAAVLGGTPEQVENAAEIGMEHNLGLTCDPVRGLVQVPCIERNTMGAVKAINAARLALRGDGTHLVPLDAVIETMRQTGEDMRSKYKETGLGGLAVNVVAC